MIAVGIDAGSRAIKIVLLDSERRQPLAAGCVDQGVEQEQLAIALFEKLLAQAGRRREETRVVATGYGRYRLGFAERTVTEITCHARGVRRHAPEARTVIDIGGQDSKFIRLSPEGAVQDFAMNDRCAAGTGCFLEMVARRLNTPLATLGALAARSTRPAAISSMCVVFAETEIVGLLASGTPPEDIVAGVQAAIVRRISAMTGRRIDAPVFFTGGVALVSGMREAMETVLGQPVAVCADPQFTGALGAALLAIEQ